MKPCFASEQAAEKRQRTGAGQDAGAHTGIHSSRSVLDCASPLALSARRARKGIVVSGCTIAGMTLAFLLVGLAATAQSSTQKPGETKSPWTRIVMVGASATAGFTAPEAFGGTDTPYLRMSRYLDAALLAPHEPIQNLAHALFFMQPEAGGRQQISDAVEAKPTLVIGVDFLFWFCYGEMRSDAERLRRFEKGLKLLEEISCPLVLGDIPDASAGVETGVLSASQVPSASVLAAANKRLKEWAASRPQVVIVPLATFMRAALADEPIALRGYVFTRGKTRALLQDDKLHPTREGAAVLALAALDAFQSARPDLSTNGVRWNPQDVFRLGSRAQAVTPRNASKQEASSALPAGK